MNQGQSLQGVIDPGTNGLVIPNVALFSNNAGPVTVTNYTTKDRRHCIYGDVKFNFQRELFLEITGRNDWSSTLPVDHNSYFYPGTNASWVFTERLNGTKFKDKVLNYGKIRAGIAAVGHGAVPYANNAAVYNQSAISSSFGSIIPPFNNIPAYSISGTFGSPNLRPEHTREFEVGTDLSFLKDRLSASFTYYNDLTMDLITLAPVSTATGYDAHYINVGDISNKGEEVTLRGAPIATKWGLRWELFGTYTHNVNNVESLTNGLENVVMGGFNGLTTVAAVGHPFGTFYGNDIQYHDGHAVVDQTTGLPIATTKPVYLGSIQPKFIASWGTDLTWAGLKLHVLFTTKQGGEFYSRTKMNTDFNGTSTGTHMYGTTRYIRLEHLTTTCLILPSSLLTSTIPM